MLGIGALCCAAPAFAANESLLTAPDAPPYKWFASTDPKHENEDYLLLKPGETRKISLAAGEIERLWWTAIEPEKIDVIVRLNDGRNYAISKNFYIRHEKASAFYAPDWNSPIARLPLSIRTGKGSLLTVTNNSKSPEGNKFFYQVSVRPLVTKTTHPELGSAMSETLKNALAPGAEAVTDFSGAGVIESIRLTLNKPDDVKSLRMRAAWDGDRANAIDAPLSALLDLFDGGKNVKSSAFDFDGKVAALKWPMPFGNGMKVTFKNEGAAPVNFTSEISVAKLPKAPAYRFHAVYGSTRTQLKKPVQMLDVTGKGAFCGLNLSIVPAPDSRRRQFAYLEGNETITADGQKFEGTGTEDFFSSAWYFPKQPFSFPYHGLTFKGESPPSVAAYRLMIPDAVPFKKSLRFDFEHGKGNNSDDLIYRWVAFWYSEPSAKFVVADTAAQGGAASLAPESGAPTGGVSQITVILAALFGSLVVGGGGAWLLKRARK